MLKHLINALFHLRKFIKVCMVCLCSRYKQNVYLGGHRSMPMFSSRITDARVQTHQGILWLGSFRVVLLDLTKVIHLLLLSSLLLLLNST